MPPGGASATLAVQEAVQMHGGIGMTDEFDLGFFMKRVRVGQELSTPTAWPASTTADGPAARAGIVGFVAKDPRRTAASHMAEIGIDEFVLTGGAAVSASRLPRSDTASTLVS